jgi:hypothetical protein
VLCARSSELGLISATGRLVAHRGESPLDCS